MDKFRFGTGALVSPKDPRDWTLASVGAATAYPKSCFIDISTLDPRNQGKIGSCVGNTFEEIVYKITGSKEDLSWRFVYAICKALDGYSGEGTYPALAAKVIRKYGVPRAAFCPNDITLNHEAFVYNRKFLNIPQEAFADALKRKSGADYNEPVSLDGIKKAILYAKEHNGAVAILREIGDTYWKDANGNSTYAKEKLLPIRVPQTIVSGHEELLYGYDEEPGTGRLKIYWLNHWSKEWADNGKGWEYADVWLPLIRELRVVVEKKPTDPVDDFKYTFNKQMKYGDKGPDVVALQHALKLELVFPDDQPFTGFYGDITKNAVNGFQAKYAAEILAPLGLSYPTGNVGVMTLKKLNKLFSNQ